MRHRTWPSELRLDGSSIGSALDRPALCFGLGDARLVPAFAFRGAVLVIGDCGSEARVAHPCSMAIRDGLQENRIGGNEVPVNLVKSEERPQSGRISRENLRL